MHNTLVAITCVSLFLFSLCAISGSLDGHMADNDDKMDAGNIDGRQTTMSFCCDLHSDEANYHNARAETLCNHHVLILTATFLVHPQSINKAHSG